jgi:acyl carrier protein
MIFEKIREIIMEQLGKEADEITMETNFRTELKADSLDLFQIISDIEDAFDISVDDIERIGTVGEAVAYVEAAKK